MTPEELAKLKAAITHPNYSHSRTRYFMGEGYTTVYHRDYESPSGVMSAAYGPASMIDPLLRQFRHDSPLSPTEGLSRR
jgi:hypothetical protein